MPPLTVAGSSGNISPQVAKVMEQLSKGYCSFLPNEVWVPNVNLYETAHDYIVCVDLSGIDKDKIDISVQEQQLVLHGARMVPQCPIAADGEPDHSRVRVHLMEIDHGAFSREVELPHNVHIERITARYIDGMLWIDLPKKLK